MPRKKLLFICTANINRSRTAEDLFRNSSQYEVQSAGIIWHELGRQVVSQGLIGWADQIFVMERMHLEHLCINFDIENKLIITLDIPDIYARGDGRLIHALVSKLKVFSVTLD